MHLHIAPFNEYRAGRHYAISAPEPLTARTGRVTVITGDSGAGKSTLLRILAGDRPPGKLDISIQTDEDAAPVSLAAFLQEPTRMAWLPQESIQREELTPTQALDYWLRILTASYAKDSAFATRARSARDELIRELFDPDEAPTLFAEHGAPKIRRLSGGQQRRLDVIMTLCSPAELVLLDEPDTGLDPERREKLFDTLCTFAKRYGKIIVAVSHYAAEAFDASRIDTWVTRRKDHGKGAVSQGAVSEQEVMPLNLNAAPEERHNRRLDQLLIYARQFAAQFKVSAWIYLLAPMLFIGLIRLAVDPGDPKAVFSLPARTLLFFYAVTCYWLGLVQSTGFWVSNGVLFLRECRQGASVFAYLYAWLKTVGVLLALEALLAVLVLVPGSGLQLGAGWIALFGMIAAWNGAVAGLLIATLQHACFPQKTNAVTAQLLALFLTLSAIVFSAQVIGPDTYQDLTGQQSELKIRTCNRLGQLKQVVRQRDPRTIAVLAEVPLAANSAFHGLWFQGEYPKRESATLYDQCRRHAVPEILLNLFGLFIGLGIILFIAKRMARLHIGQG